MQKMIQAQAMEDLDTVLLGKEGNDLWRKHFAPKEQSEKTVNAMDSTADNLATPPSKSSTNGLSSSTSAVHVYRKRKDKAPIVESQVPGKDCTEESLHKPKKKKEEKEKDHKEKHKGGQKKANAPSLA